MAAALLGYTDATLLDDTVDAFAAGDGAAVFGIVDRVVEAGHDPRRFAEDLLERLRDLIIIDAVPDAAGERSSATHPADELERMRQQAAHFGAAELSRAADIVNAGLTEMRGATAPRLQLELICARVLLPAADDDERGLAARLDRLERRLDDRPAAPATPQPPRRRHPPVARRPSAGRAAPRPAPTPPPAAADPARRRRAAQPTAEPAGPSPPPEPTRRRARRAAAAAGRAGAAPRRSRPPAATVDLVDRAPAVARRARRGQGACAASPGRCSAERPGRRRWTTAGSRWPWSTPAPRDSFLRGGSDEIVREALIAGARRRLEGRRDRRPVDAPPARRPSAPAGSR